MRTLLDCFLCGMSFLKWLLPVYKKWRNEVEGSDCNGTVHSLSTWRLRDGISTWLSHTLSGDRWFGSQTLFWFGPRRWFRNTVENQSRDCCIMRERTVFMKKKMWDVYVLAEERTSFRTLCISFLWELRLNGSHYGINRNITKGQSMVLLGPRGSYWVFPSAMRDLT